MGQSIPLLNEGERRVGSAEGRDVSAAIVMALDWRRRHHKWPLCSLQRKRWVHGITDNVEGVARWIMSVGIRRGWAFDVGEVVCSRFQHPRNSILA